jgi:Tol biopolymer transport system component
MMIRAKTLSAVVGAVIVALLVLASALPASAKVSGSNGLIAFTRTDFSTGTDATYIMNPDGTHLQVVLGGAEASVPHWSPDGSLLALQTSFSGGCPPCTDTTILNPETGQTSVLPPPDPNLFSGCSIWSPDATHFACGMESMDGSRNGIYTIRSGCQLGVGCAPLTPGDEGLTRITDAGGAADIPIDYSPAGKQIAFGRVDPNNQQCSKTSALYVVNIDGTGLHRITPGGFCDDDGSWSPNGKEIAFATTPSVTCGVGKRRGCRTGGGKLFVVHPDGTGLRRIPLGTGSRNFAGDVSWSPDGTKMTFILFTPAGGEGIATANADGTDVQQITTAPTTPDFLFDHEADWGSHPLITP